MKKHVITLMFAGALVFSPVLADESKHEQTPNPENEILEELQDNQQNDESQDEAKHTETQAGSETGGEAPATPQPAPEPENKPNPFDQSIPVNDAEGEIKEKESKKPNPDGIKTYVYSIGGRNYEFVMYKADMNDKANFIDLKIADNKIGHLNYLPRLVNQAKREDTNSEVLAAINGGLFNMGAGRQPITSVIQNGNLKYSYFKGALANFDGENRMTISRNDFEVFFAVNKFWEAPYGFSTTFINQINYDANGVGVLTSEYDGERFDKDMTVAEVKDKTVIKVHNRIPKTIENGNLLIVSESNPAVKKIKVGDRIDYVYRAHERGNADKKSPLESLRTGVGSGPVIIENGKLAIDTRKDNLADLGIYNNRPRSMVGMTKDKKLYFVVAKHIDVTTFGKLGLKLGMDVALNLDGGGSSGLMIGDKHAYVQSPQRAIANALLIRRHKELPIRISINDRERFYDTNPYIYEARTMVPLRGILEDLECKVSWDEATESVVFERYGKRFSVKKGSNVIFGKDKNFEMDVPLLVRDGRSAISARFLSEVLGGEVKWDNDKRMVEIQIASANELFRLGKDYYIQGRYETAKSYFEKALEVDPNNISSMNGIADVSDQFHKKDEASKVHLKILDIQNDYIPALTYMGRLYEEKKQYKVAIDMFSRLVAADERNFDGLKTLGSLYQETKNDKKAIEYYEKAYEVDNKSFLAYSLINLYKKELKKSEKDFELVKKTATMLEAVQEEKEATTYYEKAHALKGDDLFVIRKLAGIYKKSDRTLALTYLEKAYALDSKDLEVIKSLALLYEEDGKTETALKYYQDAFNLDQKDVEVVNKLATLYEKEGRKELALEYYEKAFAANAKNVELAKRIADLYKEAGKLEAAIDYYKKTYRLSYDEAILLTVLELSAENKDFDGAIKTYDALRNKHFKNGKIYYQIAGIHLAKQMLAEGFEADEQGDFASEKYNNKKVYDNYKFFLDSNTASEAINAEFREIALKYVEKYDEAQKPAPTEGETN
ncbi:MAG: phosphodiester glycosidase family protein [Bacillota bacterium]|nr:phosphodiester glycosidase family protein [Bacillota bacterium]